MSRASLEIFASKSLVSAKRSRLRDWFDLYVLLQFHGFSMRDYAAAFEKAGDRHGFEIGLTRLCSGRPDATDEGFHALVSNAPSLDQLREFFVARRDQFEVGLAAAKLNKK